MDWNPTRARGLERLASFLPLAGRSYAEQRNHDHGPARGGRDNVSQLSPWLHAGLLGEAEVLCAVLEQHSPRAAEKFIAEVFWRIYFKGYLEQRPSIWTSYLAGRDDALAALERNAGLCTAYGEATEGRTGIEAFDVWARELVETGYLHNHARMWFASIWIFTLKLDWQLGADFFLRHLMDGDAASNTLSWRWVAGLHTKGKHYLARPDNIARFTAGRADGPLTAEGLAENAAPMTEPVEHPRRLPDLPPPVTTADLAQPFALLLHDEAAHHAPLILPARPALVIGATRPEARSPGVTGSPARAFTAGAMESGLTEAAAAFGCPSMQWRAGEPIEALLAEADVERVALPWLPAGWTRDALAPRLAELQRQGRVTTLLAPLHRATWPHAKAGFFGVAKQIDAVLGECGIGGG
ncbi:FAD-binding domain-containing protein [Erythrobacter dokdonensis]|uniref:DNA photolyase-like protein n=1 Tax=Erythrobacter dokdonensis DSW-74 TaxID=1300349 RepID=A0A1A7BIW4_9SPHN|nr:FAD-binding domain-containing protein [Erythrobacter dokdonensis]OBV11651.1 DNA photolyase-like protein [Erythrobacter dokdonensis DSW-74]